MNPIRHHIVRGAALRLGFTQFGADCAAIDKSGQLSGAWLKDAHEHLERARDALILARAPKSADAVRRALKSVEGAQRHARLRPIREKRQSPLICPTCTGMLTHYIGPESLYCETCDKEVNP
jgi:hypothetical protein